MDVFSTDVDILRYEPVLFGDLHFSSQVLCQGSNGILEGVNFSALDADFTGKGVQAGGVIYLYGQGGDLNGSYEIVSVNSADTLTVSVLRADKSQEPVSPGQGNELLYRISTFLPQANEAFYTLTRYFGLRPGRPYGEYGVDDIIDVSVLRQVSVYMILAMVYGSLNGGQNEYKTKQAYYAQLAWKERQYCRVAVSTENDSGRCIELGGSFRLYRQ